MIVIIILFLNLFKLAGMRVLYLIGKITLRFKHNK
jgi:hypothetical protein